MKVKWKWKLKPDQKTVPVSSQEAINEADPLAIKTHIRAGSGHFDVNIKDGFISINDPDDTGGNSNNP